MVGILFSRPKQGVDDGLDVLDRKRGKNPAQADHLLNEVRLLRQNQIGMVLLRPVAKSLLNGFVNLVSHIRRKVVVMRDLEEHEHSFSYRIVMLSPEDWFILKVLGREGFEPSPTAHKRFGEPCIIWIWRVQAPQYVYCISNRPAKDDG